MQKEYTKLIVAAENLKKDEMRVDAYIAAVSEISRNRIGANSSEIILNGTRVKKSRMVQAGDIVELYYESEPELNVIAQDLPLNILYQDEQVMVINKEQGMVVHPAAGNYDGTVANALKYYAADLETGTDTFRPGIVHRLDKDTSGILITAKNRHAHEFLSAQFKEHTTRKTYIAIVKGAVYPKNGIIDRNITRDPKNRKRFTVTDNPGLGKHAVTNYQVLRIFYLQGGTAYSLIRLQPTTGRTHQLRVHMKSLGFPIVGDPIYSRKDNLFRDATLMLHAIELVIRIPDGKNSSELKKFRAALPVRYREMILKLSQG